MTCPKCGSGYVITRAVSETTTRGKTKGFGIRQMYRRIYRRGGRTYSSYIGTDMPVVRVRQPSRGNGRGLADTASWDKRVHEYKAIYNRRMRRLWAFWNIYFHRTFGISNHCGRALIM